jgi:hypothetical protein
MGGVECQAQINQQNVTNNPSIISSASDEEMMHTSMTIVQVMNDDHQK